MITFELSAVARGEPLESIPTDDGVRLLLNRRVEAMECRAKNLVACDTTHAFVRAASDAFFMHHPLRIRPDDIWFCIVQGFALHIRQNEEQLRSDLVSHTGRKKLQVFRPDFTLGQANPWPEVFASFGEQIGAEIGTVSGIVSARFSTTTTAEAAAFDICLMDGFQGYFEYEVWCLCGIPQIQLLGTPEDWLSMIPRVEAMGRYGLEDWSATLIPILEQIATTASGNGDVAFWKSLFRYESTSGGAELTGWIVALFPYLYADGERKTFERSPYLTTWRQRLTTAETRKGTLGWDEPSLGPGLSEIPASLASAPVLYREINTESNLDLRFVAGMFGVEQDDITGALSPAFGWAVIFEGPPLVEELGRFMEP